jgi:putative nucleotidyltransferase with HDIG domain
VVTGYGTNLSGEAVKNASFPDKLLYLQKPFHHQEIVQFATALSAKWKAERQLLALHSDLEALVERRTAELLQSNQQLKIEIDNGKRMQLELQHSFENLKKVMNSTVKAITTTIEKRDPYTSGHQQRVADLSRAIAREIGLAEDDVEGIYIAAAIHDIGKISLPAEILSKPVPLSDIEVSLIQAHSQTGYDILQGIDFPWPIAEIVLQHHERLDGSGYPKGLAGDDILMAARVIGVADVVETMASHRPYRPSRGIDKALEEIAQNKGALYEPLVVEACLQIFNNNEFQLPG